jgi:ABC-2 type transport system permease protein
MKKYLSLTKVLLKNSFSTFASGKKSNKKNLLYIALIALSILPMVIGIGTSTARMYDLFFQLGQEGILIASGFVSISVLILVFGIFYVVNIFYFAQDVDTLVALPLRANQITSAKFSVTLLYEYLTVILFLLPLIIAYGIKSSGGFLFYLYSFLLLLGIPVIPLAIDALIIMFILRYINISKRKDQFRIFAAIFGILLVFGINYVTSTYLTAQTNPGKVMALLQASRNSLINTISVIFPTTKLATLTLLNYESYQGLYNLFLFYVANLFFVALFLLAAEKLYFKGAVGGSEVSSPAKLLHKDELRKFSVKNSALKAFAMKEIKILFRTPPYFINCVLTNFLWPFLLLFAFGGIGNDMGKLRTLLSQSNPDSIILAIALAAGLFVSASNGITGSAISREGTNFFVNKYLAISYREQIFAKLFPGILLSLTGIIIILIAAVFLLKISFLVFIISFSLSLLGILFTAQLGLMLDIQFPKLIWDNEYKPIKHNWNVAINILASAVLGAAAITITIMMEFDLMTTLIGLTTVILILNILIYKILFTAGIKTFAGIEI